MTTVGYGDIVPQTALGRILAALVMLLGFGIIAIPTGIVTVEGLRRAGLRAGLQTLRCTSCGQSTHRNRARFCDRCGATLPDQEPFLPSASSC